MSESKRMRDKASNAFRQWARAGCPMGANIRKDAWEADFSACASVFLTLAKDEIRGRENTAAAEIRKAVMGVYMEEPRRPLRKNEVSNRVRRLAQESYVSERQVYAWLARARSLWWKFRRAQL